MEGNGIDTAQTAVAIVSRRYSEWPQRGPAAGRSAAAVSADVFIVSPDVAVSGGAGTVGRHPLLHHILPAFERFVAASLGDFPAFPVCVECFLRFKKVGRRILHHFNPVRVTCSVVNGILRRSRCAEYESRK